MNKILPTYPTSDAQGLYIYIYYTHKIGGVNIYIVTSVIYINKPTFLNSIMFLFLIIFDNLLHHNNFCYAALCI